MNTTYTVTLNAIRAYRPCRSSWCTLLQSLGKTKADDTSITIAYIFGLLGITDALWALRALSAEHDRDVRWLVCNLVAPTLRHNSDQRIHDALEVARAYARYSATEQQLAEAREDAWATLRPEAANYEVPVTAAEAVACAVVLAAAENVAERAPTAACAALRAIRETEGEAAATAASVEQERIFRRWLQRR